MAHFGVLSFRGAGHLNPLLALSRRLLARGHRVTFFQSRDLKHHLLQHGVEFVPVEIPAADVPAPRSLWMKALGLGEIDGRLHHIERELGGFLTAYPPAIRASGVDTLLMGEISLAGPTVAEMLQLPYIIVSTSIPHNLGWDAPRSITPSRSLEETLRQRWLEVSILRMRGPVRRSLDRYRRELGLGTVCDLGRTHPALGHITQWPQCLEDPQVTSSARVYFTGPFVDRQGRAKVAFPRERLDGRPLLYASLGTTRKGDLANFHSIAEACRGLGMQLVISLGGRHDPAALQGLAGDPVIVGNAPQLELLQRATIVITHAGPNTVLETLLHGRPMLALPITLDQPAVAHRLARAGVAEVLSSAKRTPEDIRAAVLKVLHDPSYRRAARRLQAELLSLDGAGRATEIIEALLPQSPRAAAAETRAGDLPLTLA